MEKMCCHYVMKGTKRVIWLPDKFKKKLHGSHESDAKQTICLSRAIYQAGEWGNASTSSVLHINDISFKNLRGWSWHIKCFFIYWKLEIKSPWIKVIYITLKVIFRHFTINSSPIKHLLIQSTNCFYPVQPNLIQINPNWFNLTQSSSEE